MKKVLYFLMIATALVACKKQPSLELDKTSVSFTTAGSTAQVNVSANYPWTATASESWIKVKYTEGDAVLSITVSANNGTDPRQGTVTVASEDLLKTITVTQDQRNAIELDSAGRITVEADEQQLDIRLKSNIGISATVLEGGDWVSVVSTKAMTPHTVTLSIKANPARTMRRALVSFADATGAVSQQVMIDQNGHPQVVLVDFDGVASFRVPALEGIQGAALSGTVFWDNASEGVAYEKSLSKDYDGAAGTLRIEAQNASVVSFANVRGINAIDILEF